ncbi:fusion protein [Exobasidium gracile totivirus 1-2]|nr:fusion protein [Exobasidium gracile totivirus 1-2]
MSFPLCDWRGVNNAVIDDSGNADIDLLLAAARTSSSLPREGALDLAANPTAWLRNDSQLSLLVTLLSLYYVRKYHETDLTKEDIIDPVYADGHVQVKLTEKFTDKPNTTRDGTYDWRKPEINISTWDQTSVQNPPTMPVLYVRGMTIDEVRIIMTALGGKQRTTPLAFDLEIPRLASIVCLAWDGQAKTGGWHCDVKVKSNVVLRTLIKYVTQNRMYGTFEAALGIYHQVCLNPVPDTAEGQAWTTRKRDVILPEFDASRGTLATMLRGKPYGTTNSTIATWKWFVSSGLDTAIVAGLYNAVSLWGRYLIEAGYYDGDSIDKAVGNHSFANSPAAAYYAYASLVTGHQAYTSVPLYYGLEFESWDDELTVKIPVNRMSPDNVGYTIDTEGNMASMNITAVPPPCSPQLVYGMLPTTGRLSPLSSQWSVDIMPSYEGYVVATTVDAWKVAIASRWFGYDMVTDVKGVDHTVNWASNQSQIAQNPIMRRGPDNRTCHIKHFEPRGKVFAQLPLHNSATLTWNVGVERATNIMIVGRHKKTPVRAAGSTPGISGNPTDLAVPSPLVTSYMPIVLEATQRAEFRELGFSGTTRGKGNWCAAAARSQPSGYHGSWAGSGSGRGRWWRRGGSGGHWRIDSAGNATIAAMRKLSPNDASGSSHVDEHYNVIRFSALGHVPMAIKIGDRGPVLASAEDADFVLVKVGPLSNTSTSVFTQQWENVRGEAVRAAVVDVAGVTATYAATATLTAASKSTTHVAGITLLAQRPFVAYASRQAKLAWSHIIGHQPVEVSRKAIAAMAMARQDVAKCREMLPKWEKSKVTGAHHTWFRPEEVLSAVIPNRQRLVALALTRLSKFTGTEAFVSGMLLWANTAQAELVEAVLHSETMWTGGLKEWTDAAKEAAADVKTHHHYDGNRWNDVFELQVLANRGVGSVDWATEKTNRTKPRTVDIPEQVVYNKAKLIFAAGRANGYRYAREVWDKYWARRWANIPTGSMHSQYKEDMSYVGEARTMKTKHYALCNMPDVPFEHYASRRAEIVAWPSEKYEWAKMRAIYGCDITTHVLTDFAMPMVEEALSSTFPVGKRANEQYVSARVELASRGGVPLCFDYEDFNSQHSLSSMQAVLRAYANEFAPDMSDEQRRAMAWALQSVYHQRVEGKDPYHSKGTLLSGWRLTTLVNTLLNHIYLDHAGALKLAVDSVHNGDDVLAYTSTLKDAQTFIMRARQAGIRAQPAKCAIGGLAEFLRVDRASVERTGAQYLTRGIATAVHARAESNEPDSPISLLRASKTRVDELEQRGASRAVCNKLFAMAKQRVSELFNTPLEYINDVMKTHSVHGGLGESLDVIPEYTYTEAITYSVGDDEKRYTKMPGVNAYARYLVNAFSLDTTYLGKVATKIARATASSVQLTRSALTRSKIDDKDLAVAQQHMSGVCRDEYTVAAYSGRARLAGVPLGRLPASLSDTMGYARILASNDPLRTLRIIY